MDRDMIYVFNDILSNISEKNYNDLYYNNHLGVDFSELDTFWHRITSYIKINIYEDIENKIIELELVYNDSKKLKASEKIDLLDFDFIRMKKTINSLLWEKVIELF